MIKTNISTKGQLTSSIVVTDDEDKFGSPTTMTVKQHVELDSRQKQWDDRIVASVCGSMTTAVLEIESEPQVEKPETQNSQFEVYADISSEYIELESLMDKMRISVKILSDKKTIDKLINSNNVLSLTTEDGDEVTIKMVIEHN